MPAGSMQPVPPSPRPTIVSLIMLSPRDVGCLLAGGDGYPALGASGGDWW
jgi:hypothetical protein